MYRYVCCEMKFFVFDFFINHFLKIHRGVLCKIAIDLLYFGDIYDVNLGGNTAYLGKRNVFK